MYGLTVRGGSFESEVRSGVSGYEFRSGTWVRGLFGGVWVLGTKGVVVRSRSEVLLEVPGSEVICNPSPYEVI